MWKYFFLSCYISTYIVSLILPLGLQSLKCLRLSLYRKSLLAPTRAHYFPTCYIHKTVICKVTLGGTSMIFFNSYGCALLQKGEGELEH